MAPVSQQQKVKETQSQGTKSYKDVVSFLDSLTPISYNKQTIERMKQLDQLFGNITKKIDVVLVGGTNGKSSAIHFASKLLKEEDYKVGAIYSSHVLTYNEQILVDFQNIANKAFTEIANEVITTIQTHKINATRFEAMLIISLLYLQKESVDVALIEVGLGGKYDATNIFNPKIAAITRIADDQSDILGTDLDAITFDMLEIAKPGSWLISAEQSKIRLTKMKDWAEKNNINWSMPIRKLASLPYIYEQLYGRTASLGERIAQIYVEDIRQKFSPFLRGNLLATKKGQRGRPTLEAKRNAELNPIKSLKRFWADEFSLLHGRFDLLDKENPSILLDNADNLDALTNLFLGVRLLHYQRPLKDFSLIIALPEFVQKLEAIKLIRYLIKKVTGQVLFTSTANPHITNHEPQELANLAKELGIKATAHKSFEQAFKSIKENTDEREGLITITGSQSLVSEYWNYREIKNLK